MKLTWLGHSAFRIEYDGAVLLIDPFLTGNPVFTGDIAAVKAGVTHVALTHGHDDHVGDAHAICSEGGAQLIANYEICMWMNGRGVENINPGNHGGTLDCGAFRITFVDANHSSATFDEGVPVYLGNPVGFVIEAEGEKTLYHMGDTNLFSDMVLIAEFHQPKIGLVPVGDRFTMGGRQAAVACKRYFNFETVIPCHYGTFPIIEASPQIFVDEMADTGIVKVVDVGEPVTL